MNDHYCQKISLHFLKGLFANYKQRHLLLRLYYFYCARCPILTQLTDHSLIILALSSCILFQNLIASFRMCMSQKHLIMTIKYQPLEKEQLHLDMATNSQWKTSKKFHLLILTKEMAFLMQALRKGEDIALVMKITEHW